MLDALELLFLGLLGIVVGTVLAAWAFYSLGLTDPVWLTIAAVLLGGPAGYLLEQVVFYVFFRSVGRSESTQPRGESRKRGPFLPSVVALFGGFATLYSLLGIAIVASLSGAPNYARDRAVSNARLWLAMAAVSAFICLGYAMMALARRKRRGAA